jgi:hypothetical protein
MSCNGKTVTCALQQCYIKLDCGGVVTPGGPCDDFKKCCAATGDPLCAQVIDYLLRFGGDSACAAAKMDPGTYCLLECYWDGSDVATNNRPECEHIIRTPQNPGNP